MRQRISRKKKRQPIDRVISKNLDPTLDALNVLIETFMEKHSLSYQEIIDLLDKKRFQKQALCVPIELFQNRDLGILEILTKYFKEEKNFRYKKIAELLNRDERTIWVSYHKALGKRKARFVINESQYWIPISIFANRTLGLLQALVVYLKDTFSLRYHEIGVLLNRDDRIIWAVYNRK